MYLLYIECEKSLCYLRSRNPSVRVPADYPFQHQHLQHFAEVRRSETRYLRSPGSSNSESEGTSLVERTGSHPAMAENPGVPQPGFEPRVMSLRAEKPPPYSQGLRKPSGARPFETSQSLSSDIMPATTCKLAVS